MCKWEELAWGWDMYRKKKQILELVICVIDSLAVLLSLILAGSLRYGGFYQWRAVEDVKMAFSAAILIHVAIFYFLDITEGFYRRGRYQELLLCLKYNIIMVISITFFGFAIKTELLMSRLVMMWFFLFNTGFLLAVHIIIRNRERIFKISKGKKDNLLIITTSDQIEGILGAFLRSKEISWNISGIILLDKEAVFDKINGIPVFYGKKNCLEFASRQVVDEVFIQIGLIQENKRFLQNLILEFENMGVVVNLNLDLFDLGFSGEKRIYSLEGYNVIAFSSRLLDYRMVLIKRLMDIVGALVGLLITAVITAILAPFLLLESPGPLIFKQKRIGRNGRVFDFYKFRSMYADAEEKKEELMDQNEVEGPMFKIKDDPRVTKVGRFIRKTSIDELPQFWNVLKGDMSLVGTRPPTLDEFQQYEAYQRRRMSFRPGITGLWQVNGRSEIRNFDDVVKLDLEYIDNWSIALDIKIIGKTLLVVLLGKGAE